MEAPADVPSARYRIESLVIEGFKAFSASQEIRVAGKHCFLFGPNARGKSSIIEAIRWCLFGSERDSDVRNRFDETTDSRVELRLQDSTGVWRCWRRLRPGQLKSDFDIADPKGQVVNKEDALPNLARLGSSAGAVVFFSAQESARVRSVGDLSRFHEVLYAHLGLTEPDRLRTELSRVLEEQAEIAYRRAQDVQATEDKLRNQLKDVGTRLDELLRASPWDLDEAPTRSATERRIHAFVGDLAAEFSKVVEGDWPALKALEYAEAWINDLAAAQRTEREQLAASVRQRVQALTAQIGRAVAADAGLMATVNALTATQSQLVELCDGARLADLEKELTAALQQLDHEGQMAHAREAAMPLVGAGVETCPICGAACDGATLLTLLTESLARGAVQEHTSKAVALLRDRIAHVQTLNSQLATAQQRMEAFRGDRATVVAALASELGCLPDDWQQSAENRVRELNERLDDLQQKTQGDAEHNSRHLKQVRALREEWRYHQLRDEEQRLRHELQDGLTPVRDRLRALQDFHTVVESLRAVLSLEFDAAVDRSLPAISNQLTEAFRRLTNHPAFDVLRVRRTDGEDKLDVRVGSTRASVPWSRPENVLNGGAYAALGLVPHFVFSGFRGEQAELNVLIIDDPSQSFDTNHVELLLEELQRASEHAQLILATHEEERFRPIIERLFVRDSFTIIRVTDFDPIRGPTVDFG